MRLSIRVPAVISGVPVPDAENPFIAAPTSQAVVRVDLEECRSPTLYSPLLPGGLNDSLSSFWGRVSSGVSAPLCVTIEVESILGKPGPGGLYASLTVAILHALARSYGDVMTSEEIVEVARLADPFDYSRIPGWAGVVDALRYSAATGKVVAWRNDEEHGDIADGGADLAYQGSVRGSPRVSRDKLGGDVYSAIVHLSGVSTLSAAVRIRDGANPLEAAWTYKPVDEAMALLLWGITPPKEECMVSPGLPGEFEIHCKENG